MSSSAMAGQDQRPLKPAILKVLLMCGIIAPILYAIAGNFKEGLYYF
jgi:hypothetical protein